jgi:hypothetical protein
VSVAKKLVVRAIVCQDLHTESTSYNERRDDHIPGELYKLFCRCCYLNGDNLAEYIEGLRNIVRCLGRVDVNEIYDYVFDKDHHIISLRDLQDVVSDDLGEVVVIPLVVMENMILERKRLENEDSLAVIEELEYTRKGKEMPERMRANRDVEDRWQNIDLEYSEGCSNCRLCRPEGSDVNDPLWFDFYRIWSDDVRRDRSGLRNVKVHRYRAWAHSLVMCSECVSFFLSQCASKRRADWEYTWPSFYWNMLTGKDASNENSFYDVYSPAFLWRFVPSSIRIYWRQPLFDHFLDRYCFLYDAQEPSPFFVDKTSELRMFWSNVTEYTMHGMLKALDPERVGLPEEVPFLLPTVLCPWGCCEFPHASKHILPPIIIQQMLPKVQLNLMSDWSTKMYLVESIRLDYIRRQGESLDYVLMNKKWPILPTMFFVRGKGMMVAVCRHHCKAATQRRLYTHPPRRPRDFKLSAFRPDQLSHVVMQPRLASPVVMKGINTVPTSMWQSNSYMGSDSCNISSTGKFDCLSSNYMSFLHEVLSMQRDDIKELASVYVKEGLILKSIAEQWLLQYDTLYGDDVVLPLVRGSTYVPTLNAIELQRDVSTGGRFDVLCCVKEIDANGNPVTVDRVVKVKRTWCKMNNNVQIEDGDGYGIRPKAISDFDRYKPNSLVRRMSMLTWVVLGCVSSVKELYQVIDVKRVPHSYSNFSGYLMTYIHHQLAKHCDGIADKKSPFTRKATTQDMLCDAFCKSLPANLRTNALNMDEVDDSSYYGFGFEYMSSIMPSLEYPNLWIGEMLPFDIDLSNISVFIVVGACRPSGSAYFYSTVGKCDKFEARSLTVIETPSKRTSQSKYWGTRIVRHGNGFNGWWEQKRGQKMFAEEHIDGRYR